MTFHIEVRCIDDSGAKQSHELMVLSREDVTMEALGLTLTEGKELLHNLQQYMVKQQATAYLGQHRTCR